MGNQITGKEYQLAKIFSADFYFHIPHINALMPGLKQKLQNFLMIFICRTIIKLKTTFLAASF